MWTQLTLAVTLFLAVTSKHLTFPLLGAGSERQIEMENNNADNYSRAFSLTFGTPAQHNRDITDKTFKANTLFSALIVASNECTNGECFPVYNIPASRTAVVKREDVQIKPFEAIDFEASWSGKLMTDRVCVAYEPTACVSGFNFLAMGDDWKYYNMMGLAPKTRTTGPVFIQTLAQEGVISSQIATLHYNTFESEIPSTLTLGTLHDDSQFIKGTWHEHRLSYSTNGGAYTTFSLNLRQVRYGDQPIAANFTTMLVSITNDLMYLGGSQQDFYFAWEAEMKAIDGVTCGISGESPNRSARCYFNEDFQSCEWFWSKLKDLDILIDEQMYRVPAKAQTIQNSSKKCQPGIFWREEQRRPFLGQTFMENFVTSYDYLNNQVKFGVNVNAIDGVAIFNPGSAPAPTPPPAPIPTPTPSPTPIPPSPSPEDPNPEPTPDEEGPDVVEPEPTPSPVDPTDGGDSDGDPKQIQIILFLVGIVLITLALIVGICWCLKWKRDRDRKTAEIVYKNLQRRHGRGDYVTADQDRSRY